MDNYKEINLAAAEIAKNNADEKEAIEGYFNLIANHQGLPQKFIDDIHEIISDEMNHSQKLSYWTTYFTGVKPAKD
jgi:rubrerythrin